MGRSLQDKLLKRKLKVNLEKKSVLAEEAPQPAITSVCNGTTEATFADLQPHLSNNVNKALDKMGYTHLTEIQKQVFDILLNSDSMPSIKAIAKTGSGKTLAYLLPLVQMVNAARIKDCQGTIAFVLTPTRELAMQTYGVLCELMQFCQQKAVIVKGGGVKKNEAKQLAWGASIVVGTPGRLVDHLYNTENFIFHNFCTLVIDEADRLFTIGFEDEMKKLLAKLGGTRPGHQTLLFSATDDPRVDQLCSSAFRHQAPVIIDLQQHGHKTVAQLEQEVVFVPSERRFFALYCMLANLRSQKVMVFVNTWTSIDYHERLLNALAVPVISIHGQLTQELRTSQFNKFNRMDHGLLLCTNIGARGWDVSNVDVIIQYDLPDDPSDYIHRVGRTARVGRSGRAIVMLREEEYELVHLMRANGVSIQHNRDLDWRAMELSHGHLYEEAVAMVQRNSFLFALAKKACNTYIKSYKTHRSERLKVWKEIFDAKSLDHDMVARGFLLPDASVLTIETDNTEDPPQKLPFRPGKAAFNKQAYKKSYNR